MIRVNHSYDSLSHLVDTAHAVFLHRGDGLAEQDEVEAGQRLHGRMLGYVAGYLAAGGLAQLLVVAGQKLRHVDEGDLPEGEIADGVAFDDCGGIGVNAREELVEGDEGVLAEADHGPRQVDETEVGLFALHDVL